MRLDVQIVREETFTFTPNNGQEPVTIRSGALREFLLKYASHKVINLTFPEGESEADLIERHGLEADRMASMTEEEAMEPVIVGLWSDGTHILIDGGHRRWFWAQRGVNVIKGWAVPEVVWRAFIFDPNMVGVIAHHPDGSLLPQRRKPSL